MSVAPGSAALVVTVAGIVSPVVLAHFGRSPANRLDTGPAVAISLATVAAGIWGLYALWSPVLGRTTVHLSGLYGLLVGLLGLIGYGLVERILLPAIDRLRTAGSNG